MISAYFRLEKIKGLENLDTVYSLLLSFRFQYAPECLHCSNQVVVNVNELQKNIDLFFYPNPTAGAAWLNSSKEHDFELYNINGQLLSQLRGTQLDLSNYKNGIYFVRIWDGDRYYTQRLVKVE